MAVHLNKFKEYHVTGITTNGKRFKNIYKVSFWAFKVNLYRGSVYGVLENGKRKLLKRVFN